MARFILTLVRHGQTIYNQDGIIQGQMDVPLSEEGRKQIWLLAKALEQHRFSKIFASDLQRAIETAQAVVDHGTVERPKVITDQRLRERGYGRLEGIPVKEYQGHARKEKQRIEFTPEGGETIDQVKQRAVSFFKELCDDFMEGSALQSSPERCRQPKPPSKTKDGSTSSVDSHSNLDSSTTPTGVSAANEEDAPSVEFTIGPSEAQDSVDGDEAVSGHHAKQMRSGEETTEEQTCPPTKNVARSSNYHKQSPSSPRSNQYYAPNVTLTQSSMRVGGTTEFVEGAIEVSYSEGSLCSQDTDDFDEEADLDGMVADVLVVAHGVLIRELMKYFIEELNCFIPKGQSLVNRVTFNTGMSRFQVDLLDGFPKMECLSIHQIDHLHQP